jgi:hypothetical protein
VVQGHGLDPERDFTGCRSFRIGQVHSFKFTIINELQGAHNEVLRLEAFLLFSIWETD